MNIKLKCMIFAVVTWLLPIQVSFAQGSKYLTAIEIGQHDKEFPITTRKFRQLLRKTIRINLDLGESIKNQLIVLHINPAMTNEFKIEGRFETSLTVSAEGPHLDLVNWKHYYSKWREIKRVGKNRFLTNSISEAESSKFPQVSAKEIRDVVLKEGDKWWANYVSKVKSPHDYPCAVSVSKISFRIMVREGEQWNVINILEFMVPMGC